MTNCNNNNEYFTRTMDRFTIFVRDIDTALLEINTLRNSLKISKTIRDSNSTVKLNRKSLKQMRSIKVQAFIFVSLYNLA